MREERDVSLWGVQDNSRLALHCNSTKYGRLDEGELDGADGILLVTDEGELDVKADSILLGTDEGELDGKADGILLGTDEDNCDGLEVVGVVARTVNLIFIFPMLQ